MSDPKMSEPSGEGEIPNQDSVPEGDMSPLVDRATAIVRALAARSPPAKRGVANKNFSDSLYEDD